MKKRIVIGFIAIVTLFATFAVTVKDGAIDKNISIVSAIPKEARAEMIKTFGENYSKIIQDNWNKVEIASKVESMIRDSYSERYPAYYGGMYISDDSQKLIIQIVKSNIPTTDSKEYDLYNKIVNLDSAIQVEYVKNSYNDLKEVDDRITQYFKSNEIDKKTYNNFSSNYVDVINNTVVIEFENNTPEDQASFKKVISTNYNEVTNSKKLTNDLEFITLRKGKKARVNSININAGGSIKVPDGSCSMGFRTTYNGKKGYVTAGHCFHKDTKTIDSGIVRKRQFISMQANDYAFVETNSTYIPTNILQYPGTGVTKLRVMNSEPIIVPNMVIAKVGIGTGYTLGRVINTSVDVNYAVTEKENGVTQIKSFLIENLVRAGIQSTCGDSGGPVFSLLTDAEGGPIPLGIVSGGNRSEDCEQAGNITYFTNINLLPAEFRKGRY